MNVLFSNWRQFYLNCQNEELDILDFDLDWAINKPLKLSLTVLRSKMLLDTPMKLGAPVSLILNSQYTDQQRRFHGQLYSATYLFQKQGNMPQGYDVLEL